MLAELNPTMPNPRPEMAHGAPQRRGTLGSPTIQNQPRAPYGAPLANQPTQRNVNQGQRTPVSHRQQESYASPQNNSQYNGANYGAPTEPNTRQPANVGPVHVRFENGQASDYRHGPQGAAGNYAPGNPAPVSPAPVHPAPQYRPANAPSAAGDSRPAYDTNYREAPLPDATPSYLGGQQRQPAPVHSQPQPSGSSRWTTP